ncbi:MAG: carbohydrate kinase, partial [Methylomonas sp.]|nr:carbohydrate kinase [Methylomonas sp.]
MSSLALDFDVLCVGHASYDLVFSVAHHPAEDEKMFADKLLSCGGGPAANAA